MKRRICREGRKPLCVSSETAGIEGDRHCMDQEKQISIMWEDASRFVEEEEIKGLCFSQD